MAFNIRMGLPEMDLLWKDLSHRKQKDLLDKNEERFFKKLVKPKNVKGSSKSNAIYSASTCFFKSACAPSRCATRF
jgi:fibrillarin-like rRNA methylase